MAVVVLAAVYTACCLPAWPRASSVSFVVWIYVSLAEQVRPVVLRRVSSFGRDITSWIKGRVRATYDILVFSYARIDSWLLARVRPARRRPRRRNKSRYCRRFYRNGCRRRHRPASVGYKSATFVAPSKPPLPVRLVSVLMVPVWWSVHLAARLVCLMAGVADGVCKAMSCTTSWPSPQVAVLCDVLPMEQHMSLGPGRSILTQCQSASTWQHPGPSLMTSTISSNLLGQSACQYQVLVLQ